MNGWHFTPKMKVAFCHSFDKGSQASARALFQDDVVADIWAAFCRAGGFRQYAESVGAQRLQGLIKVLTKMGVEIPDPMRQTMMK